MNKKQIIRNLSHMMEMLILGQVVLTSKTKENHFAGMTIAWGFFGNMWNDLYFTAAVRPSRFTFEAIKQSGLFCVNFFDTQYKDELRYFGTVSGYQEDKFSSDAFHIDSHLCSHLEAPIEEAAIIIQCEVVDAHQINPLLMRQNAEIIKHYPNHTDYHSMIYGKITEMVRHE